MTLFVSCFRSTKSNAKSPISAHAVQMQTTPFRQLLTPESPSIFSPCWTPGISQATTYLGSDSTESLSAYNRAVDEIAGKVAVKRKPLTLQLDSWERSTVEQRQYYVQKATGDCMVVCDGIAPNDGKQLFEAMRSADLEKPDPIADDLMKTLMNAYKKATNRSTKTQKTQSVRLQVLSQHSKETTPTIWEVIYASNSQSTMPCKESGTR